MKRLHVTLGDPEAGWLPISISGQGGEIEIVASYTPEDSFTDLVRSVMATYRTGESTSVELNEEPKIVLLTFTRDGDALEIEQRDEDGSKVVVRSSFESGCRELARQFKFLLERVGYEGFARKWHHRPPRREIRELWSYFA